MTAQLDKEFTGAVTEVIAVTRENDVLPRWNFEKFYTSPDSPEFKADFADVEKRIDDFAAAYEGRIASLSGDELADAIESEKAIGDLIGKLATYIELKQVQDNSKYGPAAEGFKGQLSPLYSKLVFFGDEIKRVPEADLAAKIQSSARLQVYQPMLDHVRRYIPHTPDSLDVIRYGVELAPLQGWIKLFDDAHLEIKYPFEGKELNNSEILEIIAGDPDRARRQAAHEVFVAEISKQSLIWTHVHNEIMRQSKVEGRWENFSKPWDARHLSNNVEPEVVDALETAVKKSYPRISERFYALKAQLMGLPQLEMWDRNINIFEEKGDTYIPFETARVMVLKAYREFMPEMAEIAQRFFDNGWIDAPVEHEKQGGAFAAPGAAALAHPMVMLNYLGRPRDVATMAHELGHGIHQYLASQDPQAGDHLVSTPLTFAETASVFGEMLTFQSLLAVAPDNDVRRKLLFDKVNDMINTVVRQISFYDFERRINQHYLDKGQPLTKEEIGKHWLGSARDSYGSAVNVRDDYGPVFGYIPHLVHSPFYVYAYAFGELLVDSLYRAYEECKTPQEQAAFKENYIKMLKAGGTLKADDLKTYFNLDIRDLGFWEKGLQVIEEKLAELEALCQPLLAAKPAAAAPQPNA